MRELLRDDPELLAIADAIASRRLGDRRARGRAPRQRFALPALVRLLIGSRRRRPRR